MYDFNVIFVYNHQRMKTLKLERKRLSTALPTSSTLIVHKIKGTARNCLPTNLILGSYLMRQAFIITP